MTFPSKLQYQLAYSPQLPQTPPWNGCLDVDGTRMYAGDGAAEGVQELIARGTRLQTRRHLPTNHHDPQNPREHHGVYYATLLLCTRGDPTTELPGLGSTYKGVTLLEYYLSISGKSRNGGAHLVGNIEIERQFSHSERIANAPRQIP